MRLPVHIRPVGSADARDGHGALAFLPALGFSGHSFAMVADRLSGFDPRLLVDLPQPIGPNGVTGREILESIDAALEDVRGFAPVLVGHSIGGAIAVRLIARLRFPAAALVLVDAAVTPFHLSWWERLVLHPRLWVPLVRLVGARQAVRAALPLLLREPPVADARDIAELSRHLASVERRHTMIAYYRAFLSPAELAATEQDLARVEMPVLVLRGARDHVLPNSVMAHIVDALPPGARVETRAFAFGGHLLPIEEPAAVARAIADFIETLPRLQRPAR